MLIKAIVFSEDSKSGRIIIMHIHQVVDIQLLYIYHCLYLLQRIRIFGISCGLACYSLFCASKKFTSCGPDWYLVWAGMYYTMMCIYPCTYRQDRVNSFYCYIFDVAIWPWFFFLQSYHGSHHSNSIHSNTAGYLCENNSLCTFVLLSTTIHTNLIQKYIRNSVPFFS